MTHEEWRDVVGYEGLYQVSNLGRVRSLDKVIWNGKTYYFKPKKVMKNSLMKIGYYRVTLTKDAKQKQFYVHRLVADAFIPNNNELAEVDHIDANTLNNQVSNLRWVSHEENMYHVFELGRNYDGSANIHTLQARKKTSIKLCKPVIRSDGKIFKSVKEAADYMGLSGGHISSVIRKRKCCKGFHFAFLTEEAR